MTLVEPIASPQGASNAPPYSVSELAFALKRTLEDAYGHVRLRGEIGKVTRHASGHVYLNVKDDKACIDGVIWKTTRGIRVRPEAGMEVIVSGRITTYPGRSQYQIIVETLEPAGVGALLAQLERLKARLAGEGLFDAVRKRPLPATPAVIGVVTSPTGAVIRDILHRIRERWPCRVIVWPVVVQGDAAAAQVAAAVRGFDALAPGGPVPRPDLIIVARGGGSVEDLWPFNDEALARTVAACRLPVISAVGHETDTTLIDFVSDRRAPTPTAAAEFATPVHAELLARIAEAEQRLQRGLRRSLETMRGALTMAARGLPKPGDVLGLASQRFDLVGGRLGAALARNIGAHARDLARLGVRLTPAALARAQRTGGERLTALLTRLDRGGAPAIARLEARARLPALRLRLDASLARTLARAEERLAAADALRRSLDPDRPLARGFARVHHADGRIVHAAEALADGETVRLVFRERRERRAVIADPVETAAGTPRRREAVRPTLGAAKAQGDLF